MAKKSTGVTPSSIDSVDWKALATSISSQGLPSDKDLAKQQKAREADAFMQGLLPNMLRRKENREGHDSINFFRNARDSRLNSTLERLAGSKENYANFRGMDPLTSVTYQRFIDTVNADGEPIRLPTSEVGTLRNFDPETGTLLDPEKVGYIPSDAEVINVEQVDRAKALRSRMLIGQSRERLQKAIEDGRDESFWQDLWGATKRYGTFAARGAVGLARGASAQADPSFVVSGLDDTRAYLDPKTREEEMYATGVDVSIFLASLLGTLGTGTPTAVAGVAAVKEAAKAAAKAGIKATAKKALQSVAAKPIEALGKMALTQGLVGPTYRVAAREAIKPLLGIDAPTREEQQDIENALGLDLSGLSPDQRNEYLANIKHLVGKTAFYDGVRINREYIHDGIFDTVSGNVVVGAVEGLLGAVDGQEEDDARADRLAELTGAIKPSDDQREEIFGLIEAYDQSSRAFQPTSLVETIARGIGSAAVMLPGFALPMRAMGGKPIGIYEALKYGTLKTKAAAAFLEKNALTRAALFAGTAKRGTLAAMRSIPLAAANTQPGNIKTASYKYERLKQMGLNDSQAALASYGAEIASLWIENLSEQEYLPLLDPILDASRLVAKKTAGRIFRGVMETTFGEGLEENLGRVLTYGFEESAGVPDVMRQQKAPITWKEAAEDYLVSAGLGALTFGLSGGLRIVAHPIRSMRKLEGAALRYAGGEEYIQNITDEYAAKYGFAGDTEGKKRFADLVRANEGERLDRIAQQFGAVNQRMQEAKVAAATSANGAAQQAPSGGPSPSGAADAQAAPSEELSPSDPADQSSAPLPQRVFYTADDGQLVEAELVDINGDGTATLRGMEEPVPLDRLEGIADDPVASGEKIADAMHAEMETEFSKIGQPKINPDDILARVETEDIGALRELATELGIQPVKNWNKKTLRKKITVAAMQTELGQSDPGPVSSLPIPEPEQPKPMREQVLHVFADPLESDIPELTDADAPMEAAAEPVVPPIVKPAPHHVDETVPLSPSTAEAATPLEQEAPPAPAAPTPTLRERGKARREAASQRLAERAKETGASAYIIPNPQDIIDLVDVAIGAAMEGAGALKEFYDQHKKLYDPKEWNEKVQPLIDHAITHAGDDAKALVRPGHRDGVSYIGGFSASGRGTAHGDGKDAAMRRLADASIVETDGTDRPSSTRTTKTLLPNEEGQVVMLARNSTLAGTPLSEETKAKIEAAHNAGSRFVVGDAPSDVPTIQFLEELGASYDLYHGPKLRYDPRLNSTPRSPKSRVAPPSVPTVDEDPPSDEAGIMAEHAGLPHDEIATNRDVRRNLEIRVSTVELSDPDVPPIQITASSEDIMAIAKEGSFLQAARAMTALVMEQNPQIPEADRDKIYDAVYGFTARARQRKESAVVSVNISAGGERINVSTSSAFTIPPIATSLNDVLDYLTSIGMKVSESATAFEHPFFFFRTVTYNGLAMKISDLLKLENGETLFAAMEEQLAAQGYFLVGVPGSNAGFIGVMLDPASVAQSETGIKAYKVAAAELDKRIQSTDGTKTFEADMQALQGEQGSPRATINIFRSAFWVALTGGKWAKNPERAHKYANNISADDLIADRQTVLDLLTPEALNELPKSRQTSQIVSTLLNPDGTWNIVPPSKNWESLDVNDKSLTYVDRLKKEGWDVLRGGLAVKFDRDGKITDAQILVTFVEDFEAKDTDGASFYSPAVSGLVDRALGSLETRIKLGKWRIVKPFVRRDKTGVHEILWKGQFQPAQHLMRTKMTQMGIGMVIPRSTVKIGEYQFQSYESLSPTSGESVKVYRLPIDAIAVANDATSKSKDGLTSLGAQVFTSSPFNPFMVPQSVYDAVSAHFTEASVTAASLLREMNANPAFRAALYNLSGGDYVENGAALVGETSRRGAQRLLRAAKRMGRPFVAYLPHLAIAFGYGPQSRMLANVIDPKNGSLRVIGSGMFLAADAGVWDASAIYSVFNSQRKANPEFSAKDLERFFDMTVEDMAAYEAEVKQKWPKEYEFLRKRRLKALQQKEESLPEEERTMLDLLEAKASLEAKRALARMDGKTIVTINKSDYVLSGTGKLRSQIEGVKGTPVVVSAKKAKENGWKVGDRIMAVVIPADAPHSAQACTIVGTTTYADVLIWPNSVTKKLGKDYDGDKIYVYGNSEGHWARKLEGIPTREQWEQRREKALAEGREFLEEEPPNADRRTVWETYAREGYMEMRGRHFDAIWDHYSSPAVQNYISDLYGDLGFEGAFDPETVDFLTTTKGEPGSQYGGIASGRFVDPVLTPLAGVNVFTAAGSAQLAGQYIGKTADGIGAIASVRKEIEYLIQNGTYTREQLMRKVTVTGKGGKQVEMRAIDAVYLANAMITNHAVDAPKETNFFAYTFDSSSYLLRVDAFLRDAKNMNKAALRERATQLQEALEASKALGMVKAGRTNKISKLGKAFGPGRRLGFASKSTILQYIGRFAQGNALLNRLGDGFDDHIPTGMSNGYYRSLVEDALFADHGGRTAAEANPFLHTLFGSAFRSLIDFPAKDPLYMGSSSRGYKASTDSLLGSLALQYGLGRPQAEVLGLADAWMAVQNASSMMGQLNGTNVDSKRKVFSAILSNAAIMEDRAAKVQMNQAQNPVAPLMRRIIDHITATAAENPDVRTADPTRTFGISKGELIMKQEMPDGSTQYLPLTEEALTRLISGTGKEGRDQLTKDRLALFDTAVALHKARRASYEQQVAIAQAQRDQSPGAAVAMPAEPTFYFVTAKEFEDIGDEVIRPFLDNPSNSPRAKRMLQVMSLSSTYWRMSFSAKNGAFHMNIHYKAHASAFDASATSRLRGPMGVGGLLGDGDVVQQAAEGLADAESMQAINLFGLRYADDTVLHAFAEHVANQPASVDFYKGITMPTWTPIADISAEALGAEVLDRINDMRDRIEEFETNVRARLDAKLEGVMEESRILGVPPPSAVLLDEDGKPIPLTVGELEHIKQYTSGIVQRGIDLLRYMQEAVDRGHAAISERTIEQTRETLGQLNAFVLSPSLVYTSIKAVLKTLSKLLDVAAKGLDGLGRAGVYLKEIGGLVNGMVTEEPIYMDDILGFDNRGQMFFHDDTMKIGNATVTPQTRTSNMPNDRLYDPVLTGMFYSTAGADRKIWLPYDGKLSNILSRARDGRFTTSKRVRLFEGLMHLVRQRGDAVTTLKRLMNQQLQGLPYLEREDVQGTTGRERYLAVLTNGATWVDATRDPDLTPGNPHHERIAFERTLGMELHRPSIFEKSMTFVLGPVKMGGADVWHWANDARPFTNAGYKAFANPEMRQLMLESYKGVREFTQRQNHAVFEANRQILKWRLLHMQSSLYGEDERRVIESNLKRIDTISSAIERGEPYFPLVLKGGMENDVHHAVVWSSAFMDTYLLSDYLTMDAKVAAALTPEEVAIIHAEGIARQLHRRDLDRSAQIKRLAKTPKNGMHLFKLVNLWKAMENAETTKEMEDLLKDIAAERAAMLATAEPLVDTATMQAILAESLSKEDRQFTTSGGGNVPLDPFMQARMIDIDRMLNPHPTKEKYTLIAGKDRMPKYVGTDIQHTLGAVMESHLEGLVQQDVAAINDTFIRRLRGLKTGDANVPRAIRQWERWTNGNFKTNSFSQQMDWSRLQPGDTVQLKVRFDQRVWVNKRPQTVTAYAYVTAVMQGRPSGDSIDFVAQTPTGWEHFNVDANREIASLGKRKRLVAEEVRSKVVDDWWEKAATSSPFRSPKQTGLTALNGISVESSPLWHATRTMAKIANVSTGIAKLGINLASSLRNGIYALYNIWIGTGTVRGMKNYSDPERMLRALEDQEKRRPNDPPGAMAMAIADIMSSLDIKNFDYLSGATQMAGATTISRGTLFNMAKFKEEVLIPAAVYNESLREIDRELSAAGLTTLEGFAQQAATRHQATIQLFARKMAARGHAGAAAFLTAATKKDARSKGEEYLMNTFYGFFAATERRNRQLATAIALTETNGFLSQTYDLGTIDGKEVRARFHDLPAQVRSDLLRTYAQYGSRTDERTNYDYSNIMRKPILRQPIMQMLMKFSTFAAANTMWRLRELREAATFDIGSATTTRNGVTEKATPFSRKVDWTHPVDPTWFESPEEWNKVLSVALGGAQSKKEEERRLNELRASIESKHGIRMDNAQFNPIMRAIRYIFASTLKMGVEGMLVGYIAGLSDPFSELLGAIYDITMNASGLVSPPDEEELLRAVCMEKTGLKDINKIDAYVAAHYDELERDVQRRLDADPEYRRAQRQYLHDTVTKIFMNAPFGSGLVLSKVWSGMANNMIAADADRYPSKYSAQRMIEDVTSIPALDQIASVLGTLYRVMGGVPGPRNEGAVDQLAAAARKVRGNFFTKLYSLEKMEQAAKDVAKASSESVLVKGAKQNEGDPERQTAYNIFERKARMNVKVATEATGWKVLDEDFQDKEFDDGTRTLEMREMVNLERVRLGEQAHDAAAFYKSQLDKYIKTADPENNQFAKMLGPEYADRLISLRNSNPTTADVKQLAKELAESRQAAHDEKMQREGINAEIPGMDVALERDTNLKNSRKKK